MLLLSVFKLVAQNEYKASFFGIRSNGITDNTSSIQKAINFISENGGGVLVFSVGRYFTGAVELKSNVSIKLNEGAVIVGSVNIYDYKGHKGIFWAESKDNISLTGKGVIDGRGEELLSHISELKSKEYIQKTWNVIPTLIYFKKCKNIRLEKMLLKNSAVKDILYILDSTKAYISGCYTDRH